jgi:hypothetical protein
MIVLASLRLELISSSQFSVSGVQGLKVVESFGQLDIGAEGVGEIGDREAAAFEFSVGSVKYDSLGL